MTRQTSWILRGEGVVVLAGATLAYAQVGASWLLFALLFLAPDVSMIGYLRGDRVGAASYNALHTYVGPAFLGAASWWAGAPAAGSVALIWAAHIGFDRVLGYGLKRPSGFGDTHLDADGGSGGCG